MSEPHAEPQAQVMASLAPPKLDGEAEAEAAPAPPAAEAAAVEKGPAPATVAEEVETQPETVVLAPEAAVPPEAEPAPSAAPVTAQASSKPAAPVSPSNPLLQEVALASPPAAERFAVETPEPPRKKAVWPEQAVGCPRDWVAVEEPAAEGSPSGRCAEAPPLLQESAAPAALPELQEAVMQRTTQLAGLQAAPRIPQARPDAPRKPVVKAKARSRGKGRLGPPPDCGKKYARWRYVKKVPTWYCK